MAKNYVEDGRTMDYLNETAALIKSGDAVAVGRMVGVAHADIPVGETGVLHTVGVFTLLKAPIAIEQGDKVFLVDGVVTTQVADPDGINALAGYAWAPSEANESELLVRLGV